MLTPEYLNECTDYLLGMYDALQNAIAQDVARRIVKTGVLTDTAEHQIKRAMENGALLQDITERVASLANHTDAEIARLFQEAGLKNLENNVQPLLDAGLDADLSLSPAMSKHLEAAIAKTQSNIRNLTLTTASTTCTQYLEAVNFAYMQVASGAFSYPEAVAQAIKAAVAGGNFVSYPTGARARLDVAVRRSVLTGVSQTCAQMTEMQAEDLGVEYYEVSAHSGARPSHAAWQGKVYKIHGSTWKYPNFRDTTHYGEGDGLCGWNCRHSFYPFWPEFSKPAYTQKDLKDYSAKRCIYNGVKLTDYQCSQKQREYERNIRKSKRLLAGYDAAIKEDPESLAAINLRNKFELESIKLKNMEAALKDLCQQTKRPVDSVRTRVVAHMDNSGCIVSFGRSPSMKAVWANKKRADKYSSYRYNKDGTIVVTDDKTAERYSVKTKYKPYAVLDTQTAGGSRSRAIYDADGNLVKQIDTTNHGNPKNHPFGKCGEHVHDWTINSSGQPMRGKARKLAENERKEHGDIL